MEAATKIQSVKRLVTLNGRRFIPASTDISLLHYTQNSTEVQILLVLRSKALALTKLVRLTYLRTKFAEKTQILSNKSLYYFLLVAICYVFS
jgi:hypothetical protein